MEKASFLINDVNDRGECRGETLKLENIIEVLHFIDEVEQAVLKKLSSSRGPISEIAETAYKGDHFDFPICKRMPLTRLCAVTYLLVDKYHEYKSKGVPGHVILETFRDVSLRASLYYKKTGKAGISKEDVIPATASFKNLQWSARTSWG